MQITPWQCAIAPVRCGSGDAAALGNAVSERFRGKASTTGSSCESFSPVEALRPGEVSPRSPLRFRIREKRRPLVDLSQYLPILLFLGVALALSSAFVFLPMLVSRLTGSHKPTEAKLSEYECGFPAFEDSRSQFDGRFYLVAILFIIFDLEAAFLYPWAVSVFSLGWTAWISMMIFIAELTLGLVYAWKKGALEWE